jgi:ribose transport system ATP-binding protein
MAEGMTLSSDARLRMVGIRKRFGATLALEGVDLEVAPGEVRALVGENGAGKSTLMKILSGAIRPDAGTMELDGKRFAPAHTGAARRAGIAMIYQELSLAPHCSVEDNIMLGMEPTTAGFLRRKEVRSRARRALEQLGHGAIDPRRRVDTLSIAERQIVEIARALAIGCRVLVLDEPTSTLGAGDIERLFELIAHLKRQAIAVVYISHFIEEVKRIADTFTVLRDGRTVGGGSTRDYSIDAIVALMIGRRLEQGYPRSPRTPGEVLLEVRKLSGIPRPLTADLVLRRGEILGIAGLVGAGRTELLRAIFGLLPIRRGEIRSGVYVGPASPARRWRQGIGFLSEDRGSEGLATRLSIEENILMNLGRDAGPLGILNVRRLRKRATHWMTTLGIRGRGPDQRIEELSGGNQQKVALARLLHEDVDLLLLDEPTRGIDVSSKFQIYDLIDRLASGGGQARPRAILIVSSYLPELLGICDRIAVMHRGRLGKSRPREAWDEHALMLEATGQEAAA